MAREKLGGVKMTLRLGDGVAERIDAVSANRSDFIRDAIEAALSPGRIPEAGGEPVELKEGSVSSAEVKPAEKKVSTKPVSPRVLDMQALYERIGAGRFSSRDLERHFDWLGIRYRNAEDELLRRGLIRFDGVIAVHTGSE